MGWAYPGRAATWMIPADAVCVARSGSPGCFGMWPALVRGQGSGLQPLRIPCQCRGGLDTSRTVEGGEIIIDRNGRCDQPRPSLAPPRGTGPAPGQGDGRGTRPGARGRDCSVGNVPRVDGDDRVAAPVNRRSVTPCPTPWLPGRGRAGRPRPHRPPQNAGARDLTGPPAPPTVRRRAEGDRQLPGGRLRPRISLEQDGWRCLRLWTPVPTAALPTPGHPCRRGADRGPDRRTRPSPQRATFRNQSHIGASFAVHHLVF